MSMLLIFVFGALWGVALFLCTYFLTFFIPNKVIRVAIGVIATFGLFTMPLRDEIKGAEEFEALCKKGGVYQISPNAVGQKLDLKYSSSATKKLEGFIRPVEEMTVLYTDVATGEVVATGKAYFAKGGWLVRQGWLVNSGGGDGAFIGRTQCFPGDTPEQAKRIHSITKKIID